MIDRGNIRSDTCNFIVINATLLQCYCNFIAMLLQLLQCYCNFIAILFPTAVFCFFCELVLNF